jgi:hypothetical protein
MDIEKRVIELEEELNEYRAVIIKHEDQELDPVLEELSRSLCLPLCEEVLARLPPELRNMVYSHLVHPDDVWMKSIRHLQHDTRKGLYSHPHPPMPYEAVDNAPHWWRVDYVGEIFLKELACQWYCKSTFIVDAFNSDMDRLLTANPWDILPKDLIQNICIRVWTGFGHETLLAEKFQESLGKVLRLIQTLEKPARICINFQRPTSAYIEKHFKDRTNGAFRLMDIIFPVLESFSGLVQVQGMVNGEIFHDNLTNSNLDMWKTEYRKKVE